MKNIIATWGTPTCTLQCPNCEELIDLCDTLDEWFIQLPYVCYSDNNLKINVTCPECDTEFIVTEVQY